MAQEVDVLIEEPIGQLRILVGVECRDRSRPATIEWVQQMRGKHEHRTDKLVLVSRKGFTRTAIEEARRYGIETMSLTEATEADWNVIVNKLKEVFVGRFDFRISTGFAVLAEEYGVGEEPAISAAEPLYAPGGQLVGRVGDIARQQLRQPDAAKDLMEFFYRHQDRTHATATFEVPAGSYLIDTLGRKWRVRAIRIEIECNLRMTAVALQQGALGTLHVGWGQATVEDGELFLIAIEQQGQLGSAMLRHAQKGEQGEQIIELTSN